MTNERPPLDSLVAQARNGQSTALDELLGRYRHFISLLVRAKFRGGKMAARVDSSDIVQDVLIQVAGHIETFEGIDQLSWEAWLRRIAEREVLRQVNRHLGTARRDAGRERPNPRASSQPKDSPSLVLAGWLEASVTSPSLVAVRKERAVLLADALARLSEDYRELLVQRHIEERSFDDIAKHMQRSPGAVRTMWVRALRKLKEAIGAEIELSLQLESGD
ncbi:MAG: sigma-70 family RNA polymerase sigma factor [Planctomycetota bacterium]|nr:sigma-70 family RNA polymerase sigma factor [Planctomycetota bacterium]MED5400517.1 sigma-70 family RNA polymerase sigma factor [Planctomycetota bacterium]MEE3283960.1 sigma-70 family RNA polymerase sigma factor [Planctomycetota bacterium]